MPLMTSTSSGQIVAQATQPSTSLTGSIWYDTGNNLYFANVNGTWTRLLPVIDASVSATASIALSKLNGAAPLASPTFTGSATIPDIVVGVGAGKTVLLDTYKDAVGQASRTYTANLDFDTYSEIIIELDINNISAAMTIGLQLNGTTTGYSEKGYRQDAGTLTSISNSAQASIIILSATLLSGVTLGGKALIKISYVSDGGNFLQVESFGLTNMIEEHVTSIFSASSLTSIKLLTSTGTWGIGTHISIYGHKR